MRSRLFLVAAAGVSLGVSDVSISFGFQPSASETAPAAEAAGGEAGIDRDTVAPPRVLRGLWADTQPADPALTERRGLSWAQVAESVEPAALPKSDQAPPVALGDESIDELIAEADAATRRGELFSAIESLRQAELKQPDNRAVARRLGIAYMRSGNRVRGAGYLEHVLSFNNNDAGALVLLADHASQRDALSTTLGLCDALASADPAVGTGLLADLYRARALKRSGFTRASAERLAHVIEGLAGLNDDAIKADEGRDPEVLRELRVLQTLEPELHVELGDRLLASGDETAAARAYAQIDAVRLADPGALVARRAYLALRAGDPARATQQVVTLLAAPSAELQHAELVGYLRAQGVAPTQLNEAVDAAIAQHGPSLPLLAGLAQVAEADRAIGALAGWLSARPAEPALLRQAAGLVAFDDDRPEDAEPLAALLQLTAGLMADQPDQAPRFAEVLVGEIDAYICLLRALKTPGLADDADNPYRALLVAIAYERTGRVEDAIAAYQRAVSADAALAAHARLPLARLLTGAQRPAEALAVLRGGGAGAGWEHFATTVQAMSAMGDHREALQLTDAWLADRGDAARTRLLRAELVAASGDPREACESLIRLIRQNPLDERPYKLGLRLIDENLDGFRNIGDALNMRKAILSMLDKNLPDSVTARVERAFDRYDNPEQAESAEQLLLGALESEPDNTLAWSMLIAVYELSGEEDKAEAATDRLLRVSPPGVDQALTRAARAIGLGEMDAAAEVLTRTLELDAEGVLPGRALTGDDAASLVQLLGSADPDRDTESLSLSMVKRFPDNARLNNALGYQWTVQNKNLLQAKAMIQRALDATGEDHSVLDSMAWVQYKLGQFAQAEAYQRRAIEALRAEQLRVNEQLKSSKAVLYDHMGDIMYKQAETASAIRHWQIARAQRLDPEDLMFDPELRTLSARVDAKINAVREGEDPPVEPVPGPEAHGPDGHPAELADNPGEQP